MSKPGNKNARKLTDEQELQAVADYATMSLRDLAEKYNMVPDGIRHVLKRRNVQMRPPGKTLNKTGRKSKYAD
jgi:Mor family transcriptional regulator